MGQWIVNFWMNTCEPFEEASGKRSTTAVGDPARHCRDRFYEQVLKDPTGKVSVAYPEIEVSWLGVDPTYR